MRDPLTLEAFTAKETMEPKVVIDLEWIHNLRTKFLDAMRRLGAQDREGIRRDDPILEPLAADLGIELIDDDDQQRMNEEANNYHV